MNITFRYLRSTKSITLGVLTLGVLVGVGVSTTPVLAANLMFSGVGDNQPGDIDPRLGFMRFMDLPVGIGAANIVFTGSVKETNEKNRDRISLFEGRFTNIGPELATKTFEVKNDFTFTPGAGVLGVRVLDVTFGGIPVATGKELLTITGTASGFTLNPVQTQAQPDIKPLPQKVCLSANGGCTNTKQGRYQIPNGQLRGIINLTLESKEFLQLSPIEIEAEVIPETSSILGLLALGTLGAASTLKRKHNQKKSTEKKTTKVG